MSVGVGTVTRTSANVMARSYTYTANALIHLASAITTARGLDQDYLQENLGVIEKGLRTWLFGHWLEALRVEVWDPRAEQAVEAYEFRISYDPYAGGAGEAYETQADRLRAELARLPKLRPGLSWRIIVTTKAGRPDVPGWNATKARDTSHLSRREAGQVTTSPGCSTELTYFIEGDGDARVLRIQ